MKTATTVAQMLVRAAGLVLIVLGLLFWTGNALTLIPIHMLVGVALVILLWVLAGIALPAPSRADNGDSDDWAEAFDETSRREPWLIGWAGRDSDAEVSSLALEGRLPDGLRGTLYRNGPGRH